MSSEIRSSSALTCGNVGLEALFTDDLDRARGRVRRAASAVPRARPETHRRRGPWRPGGNRTPVEAIPERAARLLGAATAIGPVGDADVNAQLEEHFFAPARLRTRHWSQAHTAGAQMGFEEAIAFALTPAQHPG